MTSVKVGTTNDLQPGMAVRVDVDETPVAVFNVDGNYFAIGDTCSHEQASLSEGFIEDDTVECPKHGATFNIKTGENLTLPATRPVPTFAVRVDGDDIFVETSS